MSNKTKFLCGQEAFCLVSLILRSKVTEREKRVQRQGGLVNPVCHLVDICITVEMDPNEIDTTAIVVSYLEYFEEGKTETLGFIIVLLYLLAFCFTIISVSGFGIYLWYLNSNAINTSRLLNNLYGFAALGGIFISPLWFIHLICVQTFEKEHGIFYVLYILKIFLGSLGSMIIVMISMATILRHFKPQKYLDYSDRWSNRIFGIFILLVSLLRVILSITTCGPYVVEECIKRQSVIYLLVIIQGPILSFLCVLIDDLWGFDQIMNRLRKFTSSNEEAPVLSVTAETEGTGTVSYNKVM